MRVLIVEDDVALGLFLQKGLKLEGHEVTWVGDGEAALIHAAEHRPDLIVLDLSLPKKDGTEVLAELRGRFDETAVLVLTGRSQVEERVKCLNLGADDFLNKPVKRNELLNAITGRLRRLEGHRLSGSQTMVAAEGEKARNGNGGDTAVVEKPPRSSESGGAPRTQLRDPKKTRSNGKPKRALDLTSHLTSMEEQAAKWAPAVRQVSGPAAWLARREP